MSKLITFLTAVTVTALCFKAYGQNTGADSITGGNYKISKHEIGISKGFNLLFASDNEFIDLDHLHDVYPDHDYQVIGLHYRYHKSNDLTFGAGVAYYKSKSDVDGSYATFLSVAPEVTWSYINPRRADGKVHARLYGLASVGFMFVTEHFSSSFRPTGVRSNYTYFALYQLTPVGLRIGGNFGGFMELGWGFKGLINVGVDMYLSGRKKAVKKS